ncbi:MAG TPA: glycosyltransferase family 1 protein [Planctomycetota bacterium]|nr:glycosyltransferase family 1 protein [Planctomycetota bacterium]
MRIAFDVSVLDTPEPTGVEKVCESLLRALARRRTGHRIALVAPRRLPPLPPLSDEFEPVVLPVEGSLALWRERLVPPFVRARGIEVFHSPVAAFPLTAPCRRIATMHEVPWLEAGTEGDEGRRAAHRIWAFLDATYADAVICPSGRTAENLVSLYPTAAPKVRVVFHGVEARFRPRTRDEGEDAAALGRCGIPAGPFFLMVGKARAKKNLVHAVRAFRVFLDRTAAPHRLVFVGPRGSALEPALERARALGLAGRVLAAGYVTDDDLARLYRSAEALLFLSHSEGFGLPPLEAMACGAPVVASDRGAIPEVVGDAGVCVSPDDPLATALALQRLVADEDFRRDLVRRGFERAARFTWEEAAARVLALYAEGVPGPATSAPPIPAALTEGGEHS